MLTIRKFVVYVHRRHRPICGVLTRSRHGRVQMLQLNPVKTKIVVYNQPPSSSATAATTPCLLLSDRTARDLGNSRVYMDSDVSIRSHFTKTASSCHAVLRQCQTPFVSVKIRPPVVGVDPKSIKSTFDDRSQANIDQLDRSTRLLALLTTQRLGDRLDRLYT